MQEGSGFLAMWYMEKELTKELFFGAGDWSVPLKLRMEGLGEHLESLEPHVKSQQVFKTKQVDLGMFMQRWVAQETRCLMVVSCKYECNVMTAYVLTACLKFWHQGLKLKKYV